MTVKRLTPPKLPAIPTTREPNPTAQRAQDAVKEALETIRGTRGDVLDRAVFLRDLVSAGIVRLENLNGGGIGIGPGSSIPAPEVVDATIPPVLSGLTIAAGFTSVFISWADPQVHNFAYVEVWRRTVSDRTLPEDQDVSGLLITSGEKGQLVELLAVLDRIQDPYAYTTTQRRIGSLQALNSASEAYVAKKAAYDALPANDPGRPAAKAQMEAAGTALRDARKADDLAASDDFRSATLIGVSMVPVYTDIIEKGARYLYWLRVRTTSDVVGPFNTTPLVAAPQSDISSVIDDLTEEINRGPLADLILNGLDLGITFEGATATLAQILARLRASADAAQSAAQAALQQASVGVPASVWDSIQQQLASLAEIDARMLLSRWDTFARHEAVQTAVANVKDQVETVATAQVTTAAKLTSVQTAFEANKARVSDFMAASTDATHAVSTKLTSLEGVVADPATGLAKSHARIDEVQNLTLSPTTALVTKLNGLDATVFDPTTGVAATNAKYQEVVNLTLSPTTALATKLNSLDATVFNPTTGVAATNAKYQEVINLTLSPTTALATKLGSLETSTATALSKATDILNLGATTDGSALATKLSTLETKTATTKALAEGILTLTATPGSALAGKLDALEVTAGSALAKATDILSLSAAPTSALMTKLDSYDVKLGGITGSVQQFVTNQIGGLRDANGYVNDPVARAGWGVRVENTVGGKKYVSGFGLVQDVSQNGGAFSEFLVRADRFAVMDPANEDTSRNVPFVIAADPADGKTKTWINTAMISKAAIQDLTAGYIYADSLAGGVVAAGYLFSPIINVGTWTERVNADGTRQRVYVPGPRQGNFSVDGAGVMHCKGAQIDDAQVNNAQINNARITSLTADTVNIIDTLQVRENAIIAPYWVQSYTNEVAITVPVFDSLHKFLIIATFVLGSGAIARFRVTATVNGVETIHWGPMLYDECAPAMSWTFAPPSGATAVTFRAQIRHPTVDVPHVGNSAYLSELSIFGAKR